MLCREGLERNHECFYRLYPREGLAVRRRSRERIALHGRRPRVSPTQANQRWSVDFVSDQLSDGRRFRTRNVVDAFTRESLAIHVGPSLPGSVFVAVFDQIAA